MPPSITKGWLYKHWEELGGVTIANKKLILKEVLYANLQRTEREVLRQSLEGQDSLHTSKNEYVPNKLENENTSKGSGSRTTQVDRDSALIDHSDEFGLADAL